MPKSNNDIPSRLYTVAVATSTTRGTYGEGGVNTSPNALKIKEHSQKTKYNYREGSPPTPTRGEKGKHS